MMMSKRIGSLLPLICTAGLLLSACSKEVRNESSAPNGTQPPTVETIQEPDAADGTEPQAAGLPTDQWVGRWTGPEGLFLDIQPSPDGKQGHYALTNKDNLDRQGDYAGVAEGASIRFERDGKALTIRPGTGEQTGFKHLATREDCLIVVEGQEGYCR